MKETIQFIKKMWANKRTRAIAILIIYAIFFMFVFILISNGTHETQIPEEPDEITEQEKEEQGIEIIKNIKDYKLEFVFEETFTYDSSTNLITYKDKDYLLEEKPLELSDYKIGTYTPTNIYNLLKTGVLETTNHLENSNTYLVKYSDYENIFNNSIVESDENIRITTYNEPITKIKIELSSYVVNVELRG